VLRTGFRGQVCLCPEPKSNLPCPRQVQLTRNPPAPAWPRRYARGAEPSHTPFLTVLPKAPPCPSPPEGEETQTQCSPRPQSSDLQLPRQRPHCPGDSQVIQEPSPSTAESLCADNLYVLNRQEILGSAASAGSRYTSWGWSRAGVIAR